MLGAIRRFTEASPLANIFAKARTPAGNGVRAAIVLVRRIVQGLANRIAVANLLATGAATVCSRVASAVIAAANATLDEGRNCN
jgi:hypothetical protein